MRYLKNKYQHTFESLSGTFDERTSSVARNAMRKDGIEVSDYEPIMEPKLSNILYRQLDEFGVFLAGVKSGRSNQYIAVDINKEKILGKQTGGNPKELGDKIVNILLSKEFISDVMDTNIIQESSKEDDSEGLNYIEINFDSFPFNIQWFLDGDEHRDHKDRIYFEYNTDSRIVKFSYMRNEKGVKYSWNAMAEKMGLSSIKLTPKKFEDFVNHINDSETNSEFHDYLFY